MSPHHAAEIFGIARLMVKKCMETNNPDNMERLVKILSMQECPNSDVPSHGILWTALAEVNEGTLQKAISYTTKSLQDYIRLKERGGQHFNNPKNIVLMLRNAKKGTGMDADLRLALKDIESLKHLPDTRIVRRTDVPLTYQKFESLGSDQITLPSLKDVFEGKPGGTKFKASGGELELDIGEIQESIIALETDTPEALPKPLPWLLISVKEIIQEGEKRNVLEHVICQDVKLDDLQEFPPERYHEISYDCFFDIPHEEAKEFFATPGRISKLNFDIDRKVLNRLGPDAVPICQMNNLWRWQKNLACWMIIIHIEHSLIPD